MEAYQDYIIEFNQYVEAAIVRNEPTGDRSLKQGTLSRVQTFVEDFYDKIKVINDELVKKGNELLERAEMNKDIDSAKLRADLFDLGKAAIGKFVSRYKPR